MNTMPVSNVPMPKVIDNRLTSLDLIEMLLAHGANVNAQLKSQQAYRAKLDRGTDTVLTTGTTPLLRAAKAGDVAAVRLLLGKGADAKLATQGGDQPADDRGGARHERGRHHGTEQNRSGRDQDDHAAARRRPGIDSSTPPTTRAGRRCTARPCRDTIRLFGFWPSAARSWTSRTSADSRPSMSRWDSQAASGSTGKPAIPTKVPRRCCAS